MAKKKETEVKKEEKKLTVELTEEVTDAVKVEDAPVAEVNKPVKEPAISAEAEYGSLGNFTDSKDVDTPPPPMGNIMVVDKQPETVQLAECWVVPNETFESKIGQKRYNFAKGEKMRVNTEVRDILIRSGKVLRLY